MALKKRPCRICRRWFRPHPRVGDRQKVCSTPACQKQRHQRADSAWHKRNPDYDRDRRLRERLLDQEQAPEQAHANPLRDLDWAVVQEATSLETRIVVEECAELLVRWAQDAVSEQLLKITEESG